MHLPTETDVGESGIILCCLMRNKLAIADDKHCRLGWLKKQGEAGLWTAGLLQWHWYEFLKTTNFYEF